MALTGTVWADTVWGDVWAAVWAAPPEVAEVLLRMTPNPTKRVMLANPADRVMTPNPNKRRMVINRG